MGLQKMVRKLKRAILRDEPTYYDMFENQGERFFARLYLRQILGTIQGAGGSPPLELLDGGCQSGRLSIPLSRQGHRVTAVDTSDLALRRLRRHAKDEAASVKTIRADLTSWLPRQPTDSFDIVICTEVLYLRENYRQLLAEFIRVLKPAGLGFVSHRPGAYYLAEAFQRQDTQTARLILSRGEGKLWGSYYNWQTREELQGLYSSFDVEILSITPIGFLSWLAVNPEGLDEEGQDLLFQAETAPDQLSGGVGRYLLVSFRKRP